MNCARSNISYVGTLIQTRNPRKKTELGPFGGPGMWYPLDFESEIHSDNL